MSWAENSDVAFEHLTASVKRALAGRPAPVRIVEAGCGRRWALGDLGTEIHVTGIDRDREALRLRVERQTLRIRERIPPWLVWLLGAVPVAVLLAVWFAATAGSEAEKRLISPTILPSPVEVVKSFPQLWFDRALMRNLLVSLGRVVEGFAVAVALVFPLGLLATESADKPFDGLI